MRNWSKAEGRSFDSTKPSNSRESGPKLTDLVDMFEWPAKVKGKVKSKIIRAIANVEGRGTHQIPIVSKAGKDFVISKTCLRYDVETDERDSTKKCPYCDLEAKGKAKFKKTYYVNVIDRELQEEMPSKVSEPTKKEASTGFKDVDSKTWTPVRVLRVPMTLAKRLQTLGEKNLVLNPKTKEKKAFPITHTKYGIDLDIMFDPDAQAANMYSADATEGPDGGKRSPLSDEEKDYLIYDLSSIYEPESLEDAKREAANLAKMSPNADDEDEDEDEDDDIPSKKSKSKSRKPVDEDEDDEDDDDDDEDLDDDDDLDDDAFDDKPPKSKSKSRKPADEDDDDDEEDEDEDLDDEDEEDDDDFDDEPPKKSKAKPASKSKSRKPADEDDDEDDDFDDLDDEDEEEDEPPKRSTKTKSRH